MVVVIANRHTQHFLRLFLLDDESIQVGFYFTRLAIEPKTAGFGFLGRLCWNNRGCFCSKSHSDPLEMLPHKIRHLLLDLLRGGRAGLRIRAHLLGITEFVHSTNMESVEVTSNCRVKSHSSQG